MKQWLKLVLIALVVLTVAGALGQGCAQYKHNIEQSSVHAYYIGVAVNENLNALFYDTTLVSQR